VPLPVITDIARVTLNWRVAGGPRTAHNVMHFLDSASDPAALFADINSSVTAGMWDPVIQSAVVESVTIIPLDGSSAGQTFPVTPAAKWTGAGLGTDFVPQACGVVSFKTALRGRSHRGRVFLPFVAESEQIAGVMQDQTAWAAAWELFRTNMLGHTKPLHVASYALSTSQPVTHLNINPNLKTQRRRANK
jgi:hypothetical protein